MEVDQKGFEEIPNKGKHEEEDRIIDDMESVNLLTISSPKKANWEKFGLLVKTQLWTFKSS